MPQEGRKVRAGLILRDSIKDYDRGGLAKLQFTREDEAERARQRLQLAADLAGDKVAVPVKIDLALALAALKKSDIAERARIRQLVREVEPDLKKSGKVEDAWYPLKLAYASASAKPEDRLLRDQ